MTRARTVSKPSPFYTPGEVAAIFRVDPKTVTRWVNSGWFAAGVAIRTPGGHHRFRKAIIDQMVAEGSVPSSSDGA